MHTAKLKLIYWETPLFVNEAQIPCTKEYLFVFPYEYTHVHPYRYTWYICIAMMIYTIKSVLKAEPGKLDIKRREPGILFISLPLVSLFKLAIMT